MTYVLSIFIASFLVPGIVIIYCYVRTWQFILIVGEGGAQENIEWTHEKQVAKVKGLFFTHSTLARKRKL